MRALKYSSRKKIWLAGMLLLSFYACQHHPLELWTAAPSAALPSSSPTDTALLENDVQRRLLEIQDAWQNGPHGNASRPNSNRTGTERQAVGCNDCHTRDDKTLAMPIAWWNIETQRYEPVSDNSTLCLKCHGDVPIAGSQLAVNSMSHEGFQCTDCHEPHSAVAACSNSSCHANIIQFDDLPPATPTGGHPQPGDPFCGGPSCHPAATKAAEKQPSIHGQLHARVTCAACHDASNLAVGPNEDGDLWITWQSLHQGEIVTNVPYFSHQVNSTVACKRCHFVDNPWGLSIVHENNR